METPYTFVGITNEVKKRNNLDKMIKYVILDFDGTIGDTQGLIVGTLQSTMKRLQMEVKPYDVCAATIGLRLDEAFTSMYEGMGEEEGARCAAAYREIFAENKKRVTVKAFPHVLDTIRELHAMGVSVAIASSRYRISLLEYVRQMNIKDCVRSIVAGDDVEHVKPAPDMVDKALDEMKGEGESMNEAKARSIVVGDMTYDVDMAHNAGVRACAVTYGNGTREELISAEHIIDDFSELVGIVKAG